MKIVLLPGLDGTGKLFKPFIEALPKSIETEIISYDKQKRQSYQELIDFVISKLPQDNYILLAESFSGYIAYKIALKKPKNLKHIIFVATFLKNPRPILLNFILYSPILYLPLPKFLIKLLFFDFSTNNSTIELFQDVIKKIPIKILYFRLHEIKKLKLENKKLTLPVTFIQANNDQLVPKNSINDWKSICKKINLFQIDGKHFILQSNPNMCVNALKPLLSKPLPKL